jgi:hypothetical protein
MASFPTAFPISSENILGLSFLIVFISRERSDDDNPTGTTCLLQACSRVAVLQIIDLGQRMTLS